MSKISGVPGGFYAGVYDLSGDIGAITSLAISVAQQDVTGLDKNGTERVQLRADSEMSWTGFWNTANNGAPEVLAPLARDIITTFAAAAVRGGLAGSLVANRAAFATQLGADGSLAISGQSMASTGLPVEWGRLLTNGKETFAAAAATTYIDRGAGSATNFGLAAYVHAISIGSGSATVTIQDSGDHVSWDAVIASAAIAAAGTQRLLTSLTENVRRYLRLDVTGTFTDLVLVVNVVPYVVSKA
jgi:hypothetical protein